MKDNMIFENNSIEYNQIQQLKNIIFFSDKKHLEKEDCDEILSKLMKNQFSYRDLGRLYPFTYNNILLDLSHMYNSHVYPIMEILIEHIYTYTDDDIHMYPCILRHACIYGRLSLMKKMVQETRLLSDVRDDYIQSYITYSFWGDLCKKLPKNHDITEIQNTRIEIANTLFYMYPDLMISSSIKLNSNIDKYYQHMCEMGLYLIGEYILLFCNRYKFNMKMDSFDKMFLWGCENGKIPLIEVYCKWNPYKYTIIHVENYIMNMNTSDNFIIPIHLQTSHFGMIRSFRNEMWERRRLILYKLHYENVHEMKNLPIDILRHVFSYLK